MPCRALLRVFCVQGTFYFCAFAYRMILSYYLRWKQTKTPRASNKTPLHYAVMAWCVLYCQSWVLFSSSRQCFCSAMTTAVSGKVLCCVHSLRTELAVVVSTVYLTDLRPLRGCHCNGTVRNRNPPQVSFVCNVLLCCVSV